MDSIRQHILASQKQKCQLLELSFDIVVVVVVVGVAVVTVVAIFTTDVIFIFVVTAFERNTQRLMINSDFTETVKR